MIIKKIKLSYEKVVWLIQHAEEAVHQKQEGMTQFLLVLRKENYTRNGQTTALGARCGTLSFFIGPPN